MYRNRNRRQTVHPIVLMKMTSEIKEHLPVIVYSNGTCDHIRECIVKAGGRIKYELPLIHAIATEMPSKSIQNVAQHHMIQYINYDTKVFKCIDICSLAVGSDLVNESGFTGKGIGVAVVDTGVSTHNDLTRPTNRIVAFKDFVNQRNQPYDDDGHGTHVSGIIAGNGFVEERYKGIAPEANIIGVKVLDETGSGTTSDILAGLQWIADNKDQYNIKVVCMSLGSPASASSRQDPLSKGVSALVGNGLTVLTAAGNSGPSRSTITSPGINPDVITVGATDDNKTSNINDDFVADFSSRGPTIDGFAKPDVVAPGVDIISLSNKSVSSYVSHSGTSMATPMVAGAAALVYEKYPNLSPAQVKSKIINSCVSLGESRYAQGAGCINIRNMLDIKDLVLPSDPQGMRSSSNSSSETMNPTLFLLLLLLL